MKDAKGHGSDGKGGAKASAKGMRLIKTHTNGPHSAKVYNNPEKVVQFFRNGQYQPKADYHTDDVSDAHATAQSALARYASQDSVSSSLDRGLAMRQAGDGRHVSNFDAAKTMASGPKSAQAPVHDGMGKGMGGTWTADAVREFARRIGTKAD